MESATGSRGMEGRKAESGEMGSDDIYHQGIIPLLGGATVGLDNLDDVLQVCCHPGG